MKHLQILYRGALGAIAALSALVALPPAYAQSVTVNGAPTCSSAPSLTMDPSGNLSISCTPVTAGSTGTFSCTLSANPLTVQAGSGLTATVTATCSNGTVSSYAWTNPGSAPTNPAALATTTQSFTAGPFTAAGSFSFGMTATSSTNATSTPPQATVTVTAAGTTPVGTPAGCAAPAWPNTAGAAITDTYAQVNVTLSRGSSASYALPMWAANTVQHAYYLFQSAQSTASQSNLGTQFSISTCPGDFTSNPPSCRYQGVADTGGTTVQGNSGAGAAQYCWMAPTTQYYLNVRNVAPDLATASCNAGTCAFLFQMHTGYY